MAKSKTEKEKEAAAKKAAAAAKKAESEIADMEPWDDSEFNLTAVHDAAMRRHAKIVDLKKRDVKYHLQPDYEIDVKASYKASLPFAKGNKVAMAHLESVLASGIHRKDH